MTQLLLKVFLCPASYQNFSQLALPAEDGTELYVSAVWNRIIQQIPGRHDDKRPHEFQTVEYGTSYNNTLTKLLVDKFGVTRKRRSDGIVLRFDKDKLERFARAYRADGAKCRTIDIRIIEDVDEQTWNAEGSERNEGSDEASDSSAEKPDNGGTVITLLKRGVSDAYITCPVCSE